MTFGTLIRRSLHFHARSHLGVLVGATIGSAALIGALAVGDSVQGSLRARALGKLGWVHLAFTSTEHPFPATLQETYFHERPVIFGPRFERGTIGLALRGTATKSDSSSRANMINVLGVPSEFWPADTAFNPIHSNSIVLNNALASQLGARVGDEIILRIAKPSSLSPEVAITRHSEDTFALRRTVQAIASAAQMGDFALNANVAPPLNAFLPISELSAVTGLSNKANLLLLGPSRTTEMQRELDLVFSQGGKLNRVRAFWFRMKLLFARLLPRTAANDLVPLPAATSVHEANRLLQSTKSLGLLGLTLSVPPALPALELRSDEIFLSPQIARAVNLPGTSAMPPIDSPDLAMALAEQWTKLATNHQDILSYLANLITDGTNTTPYSIVTAAGPPYTPADLKDDEIVLNEWLAADLQAKAGDEVSLTYFAPESGARLVEKTNVFHVRSIAPMSLPWADRSLMPHFPGIENAESTQDWDAGFPLTYTIRPKDEAYWKQHRGTPKAFISLTAGEKMWANRFGNLTAIRFPRPDGTDMDSFRKLVEEKLLATITPERLGLHFEPVREQALNAADQSQDFGQLFLGFSFFLVLAALLLMALLFQFGLEQRVTEIGTFLALGFTPRQVRRLFLLEGAALALLGGVLGTFAGLGYAKAMLWGLTTIWRDAIGTSSLQFFVTPSTLGLGLMASTVVAVITLWLTLRKQARQPARELLAGESFLDCGGKRSATPQSNRARPKDGSLLTSAAMFMLALAIVIWAVLKGETSNPEVFFSAGSLLLIAGLAGTLSWLRSLAKAQPEKLTLSRLGVRACARRRKRSVATVALLASGCFLIVAIGAFRLDANQDAARHSSGTGGFALIGQSTLPVVQELNTESGRDAFALNAGDLASVQIVPFRVHDGDDASCLNLNRAQKPRLLGVKPDALAGRFTFANAAKGLDRAKGWELLRAQLAENEIPAIGDANSIQWALGKKLGETLDYTDERGQTFKLRLVGAVANSILQGNLVIDETAFIKRFPNESGYRMFLLDTPSNKVAHVSAALARALQDVGLELTPAVQRLNQFNAVQNTYLGTFQILGGLGLLLGSAGLGIVVLRNVLERRGELALLSALGFTRATLQKLVLGEHAALLLLGLTLGTLCAVIAVLPAIITPAQQLPWLSLSLTLGAVVLNGLLWTWLATRYAVRGDLLRALRNE